MKFIKVFVMLFLVTELTLAACTPAQDAKAEDTIGVTVSILPEKYFVERIGGSLVSVNVMVGSGADPHIYEPKPSEMAALSNSAIFFPIGVDYETAWLERITSSNPNLKIVDLSEDIQKIPMSAHQDEHAASEGEGLDPHVWTSPALVSIMAERIYAELAALDPANEATYKTNLDTFKKDIDALDLEIHSALDGLANRRFMVFHPGWAYFAKDYALEEIPIEIGGAEPSASELADLIDTAKAENIKVIFAQPEFSTQVAKYIAKEIGGEVLLISNLSENWLQNLQDVVLILKKSLES